jgi:hypothetical protein
LLFFLLWPTPAHAAIGDSLAEALDHCAQLERDADRLDCYDRVVERNLERAATSAGIGEHGPVAPERAGQTGMRPSGPAEPVESSEARPTRILTIDERPRGERIFVLENGERWTEQTRERTRFREGDAVTVQRTALGGALLVREAGGATRVRPLD